MKNRSFIYKILCFTFPLSMFWSCKTANIVYKKNDQIIPGTFVDSVSIDKNIAKINWKDYFGDEKLISLIDSAIAKNQELKIVLQEIAISQSEVLEKQGE